MVTLKLRVGGHSRSSKMPPFDSMGMVFCSTYIATMAVSRTVSEIHRLVGRKSPNFLTTLVFGAPLVVKLSASSNNPQ